MRLLTNNYISLFLSLYNKAGIKGIINTLSESFIRHIGFNKYYGCAYIESGLSFFNEEVRFCCVDITYSFAKMTSYEELNDLDAKKIKEIRETLKSSPLEGCKECTLFTKGAWKTNKKFNSINILHGDICNFKCQYCYQTVKSDYSTQQAKHKIMPYLENLYEKNLISDSAYFGYGGEPALHPEINEILNFTKKLKNSYSTITTNASVYLETIDELLKLNKCEVLCSVDAGSRELFAKIKGVDCFDKVINNLKKYAASGRVVGKYIVFEENLNPEEIINFVKIMKEVNVRFVKITFDWRYKAEELPDDYLICAVIGKIWADLYKVNANIDCWLFKDTKQIYKRVNMLYDSLYKEQKEIFQKQNPMDL